MSFDSRSCAAALVRDIQELNVRDVRHVLMVTLHDEEVRSGRQSSGSGSLHRIGERNYRRAMRKFHSVERKAGLQINEERVRSLVTQTLSRNAVEAYKSCLAADRTGPVIYIFNATPSVASLIVGWKGPVGAPATAKGEVVVSGGRVEPDINGATWANNGEIAALINRDKDEDFYVSVTINNEGDSAMLAKPLPPIDLSPDFESDGISLRNGTKDVGNGYIFYDLTYRHIGPSRHRHEFSFRLEGPNGYSYKSQYVGENDKPWDAAIVSRPEGDLYYGFSNWNDFACIFHYAWE